MPSAFMPTLEPERFADHRPMLLGGIRRVHAFATAQRDIPGQWVEFNGLGRLPGQLGATSYGVICGASIELQTMEYMCGVEVESLDALPAALGRLRVPSQHYAVFLHRGHVRGIGQTWDGVWAWLAESEYESAQTPDFERYDDRYDPASGSGEVEIWVPVRRRAAAI